MDNTEKRSAPPPAAAKRSPPKLAYSIPEAVEATGLSKSTLIRRVGDGTIETVKVGRRRLIVATALHRLLASHE